LSQRIALEKIAEARTESKNGHSRHCVIRRHGILRWSGSPDRRFALDQGKTGQFAVGFWQQVFCLVPPWTTEQSYKNRIATGDPLHQTLQRAAGDLHSASRIVDLSAHFDW
jgi:hypothetical protein